MPLGVIGGSSFLESSLFSTLEVRNVPTKYGDCRVRVSHDGQLVFIQRHEPAHPTSTCTYLPPHAIQHKAHIAALQAIGVQHVIGFASVGSLHSNISVGTVLVPDDFYLPGNSVEHFAQDHAAHIVPGFDEEFRRRVIYVLMQLDLPKLICDGVYAQTRGPRFETKAEIKALAQLGGSVVGMTCVHEATLCKEVNLPYAVVSIVDNMANGIFAEEKLSYESFKEAVKGNRALVEKIAESLVKNLSSYSSQNASKTKVDLIVQAKYIVPIVPDVVHHDYSLVVDNERIVDILPTRDCLAKYAALQNVRLDHHALLPGFVNAHTHLGMTNLRGFADDLILIEWLTKHIWPAEGKFVSPEFTRDGSELGLAEAIRSGTTTFNDMYFFPESFCEVVDRVGVRAAVGMTCFEFPSAYASNADDYIEKGLQVREAYKSHPRIKFTTAPHAPYTVKDETFEKVLKISKDLSCPVHVHLHETQNEITDTVESRESMQRSLSEHKIRPFANLQRMGLVNDKLVAVHMTALDDNEINILAKAGSHVVHCPTSNLKLSSGVSPLDKMLKAGVNVALGTDSVSSNNSLNMFEQMKLAAILAKVTTMDPTAVSASKALEMATINGARALGMANEIGSLEKGKFADFIAVDFSCAELVPVYSVISHLVYSAGRENVSDVWVSGRRILKNRHLETLDLESVLEKSRTWAVKISKSIHQNSDDASDQ